MPRPRADVARDCLHRTSGQAIVYVNRKPVDLGAYGSPESRQEYVELLTRLAAVPTPGLAGPNALPTGTNVAELCLKYATEELTRFSKAERDCQATVIRLLCQTLGETLAAEFGPLRPRMLRDAMIAGDPLADPPSGDTARCSTASARWTRLWASAGASCVAVWLPSPRAVRRASFAWQLSKG